MSPCTCAAVASRAPPRRARSALHRAMTSRTGSSDCVPKLPAPRPVVNAMTPSSAKASTTSASRTGAADADDVVTSTGGPRRAPPSRRAPGAARRSARSRARSGATLSMMLSPSAQSAAMSIAMPARMSGDSTRAANAAWTGRRRPRDADRRARSCAPMPISLSTKNSRDSNIFSWMRMTPSHCVAVTSAMDIVSAGNAGHG